MTDYSADHASALVDVADAGTAVTFTRATPGTYDGTTDTWTAASATTVTGSAVEDTPNKDVYDALSLTQSSARTLFFVPDTYGALPLPGYGVTWAGAHYTVRAVDPIAPDGIAIAASIVVSN